MRLLVTEAAAQPPRQATAWLIYSTLGIKIMKIQLLLISLSVLAGCKNVPIGPRPITQVVKQALEYSPNDEFTVVAREVGRPMNKSRLDYWEQTTISVTPSDYARLMELLKSDDRFTLAGSGEPKYYKRDINQEVFITWQSFRENEITFTYSERKR